jgi:hypothetical protein
MGYDLKMRRKLEVDQSEVDRLRAEKDAIWEKMMSFARKDEYGNRDMDSYSAVYPEWVKVDYAYDEAARPDYFRLNNVGMGIYTRVMLELRMVHWREEWPGIWAKKFTFNDGDHVTPEECRQALAAWDNRPEGPFSEDTTEIIGSEYWKYWIRFLARAANNGGFEVH